MVLGAIGCMSDNPVIFYLLCTLSYISFCASFLYIFEVFELLAQYTLATVGEVRTAFLLTFISWNLFPLAMVLQRFGFLNDLTHQAVVVFLDLGTKIFFSHLMHTILSDFDGMNARVKRVISANARESRQSAEVMRSFVKGICHDIRVPLHSIVLGIQDVLSMNVEEEVEDTVKLMDASAQQMLELLNEVPSCPPPPIFTTNLPHTHCCSCYRH
jgi:signal transduction histidine kinase